MSSVISILIAHIHLQIQPAVMLLHRLAFYLSIIVVTGAGCKEHYTLERVKVTEHYASGSGMAFFHDRIYITGDDMNYLLITDADFNAVDSIPLPDFQPGRMEKNIKQDLEAAAIVRLNRSPFLLLLGSGSQDPYRNTGWLIDLKSREKMQLNLTEFYQRLQLNGIKEVNIEGVTWIPGGMLLLNRGNKTYPKNHLVYTSSEFWKKQGNARIKLIKVGTSNDSAVFNGVSGAEYAQRSDRLLLTISTENTYSARADGTIGKSYLWIINNFSGKKRMAAINPDQVIDLESIDQRFAGQKIESVCILNETRDRTELAFVADNDKGSSVFFKVTLSNQE